MQELAALLQSAGVFKVEGRAQIFCTGDDRVRWLNGMVTNHVGALEKNRGCYAFVLNAQGRIQGDLNIYQHGDALWLDTDAAQVETLTTLLDRFIIMDDVTLTPAPPIARLGIAGPLAVSILEKIGLDAKALEPLELREQQWNGAAATVVASHGPLVPRYEIWIAPDEAQALLQAALDAGATECSAHAVEQLRVLEGTLVYGKDISARDLPQETNQMRALHFSKGCYLGQEIVERIRSRGNVHRTLSGFRLDAALPTAGDVTEKTAVMAEGQAVGDITSAVSIVLPNGAEQCFALGYIRREVVDKKTPLEVKGIPATACGLPFRLQEIEVSRA